MDKAGKIKLVIAGVILLVAIVVILVQFNVFGGGGPQPVTTPDGQPAEVGRVPAAIPAR